MRGSLLLLLGGLLILCGLAAGQPASDGEADADEVPRTVEVRRSADGVAFVLERRDEPTENPVVTRFDAPNATLTVTYDDGPRLAIVYEALIKYRDTNGNGTFDPGEPIATGRSLLSGPNGTTWADPIVTNVTFGDADGKRVVFPAEVVGNTTATVAMEAYGERVRVGNTSLRPTGVRAIFSVENYDHEADDTTLALLLAVRVPSDQAGQPHRSPGENERGFATSTVLDDRSVTILYAWQTAARVDGETRIVQTAPVDELGEDRPGRRPGVEATERYALSYGRGDAIGHEAETEVAFAPAGQANGAPGWTAGVALLAAAAAGLADRRRTP